MKENPKTIYFGSLSIVEKLNVLRLWLLIHASKYDNRDETTTLEVEHQIDKLDTRSYLKAFILEGVT